ncbi:MULTISPECIES: lipid-binding SYLF domain-containing protein [Shewanella]|uniref:Lipid-binding SYLF domain-containing protein n=1 Tax=Shewanella holmiensis TaxID=2952222 RepID=A0A9X3AUG0_9GAMM|nr:MULTISPECIES: lipid-binding SYLF domain-containing protein [Shewanella]MCT7941209.1 lipid-binding SYLF domain-containing protein [Shewanella holmiensis]MDP5147391.1 lipid-binding SYLF domain-containing protein [Shewanella sp. ULN5]
MNRFLALCSAAIVSLSVLFSPISFADDSSYSNAITNFQKAPETQAFFNTAYGYALFPTVGKGGMLIGGAYGKGRVYKGGMHTGDSSLTQVSIGFQLGGQAYSEIIFFKNAEAYNDFTSGSFEFSAQASAVAINLGASAQVGTTGNSAGAGQAGSNHAAKAVYMNGMAIFTAAKGGLMYEAALAGQSFTFDAK